jgi:hypothetical protein
MITHYLKYLKQPERKTRFNLIAYSLPAYENDSFNPLVKPFIYAGRNPNIKANVQRKSDLQITWNTKFISSVYFSDIENPVYAYGDINNTNDLIIFNVKDEIIEMFILRDNKNHLTVISDLLSDSELNPEMEYLRNNSVTLKAGIQSLETQSL